MLTPRLELLIKYVKGKKAADIGTDHAYVPIRLAHMGMSVIATDISDGPLKAAKKNIERTGENIELRKGSGLKALAPGEVDTIIIAGMGGELIEKILRDSPEVAASSLLILQPMNSQEVLRKYLLENEFYIIKEDLEKEGHKIYNLFVVCKNTYKKFDAEPLEYIKEIDLHLPPSLCGHKYFNALVEKKMREFSKICTGLKTSQCGNREREKKYTDLLSELIKIKEGH